MYYKTQQMHENIGIPPAYHRKRHFKGQLDIDYLILIESEAEARIDVDYVYAASEDYYFQILR